MPTLVPIPWQPDLYLTPDTLAYLQAASDRLNTHLAVAAGDGAWRSYASQKALRDYYLADTKNHPFAADPDTGQRNHMRGAAFDLVRTDAAAQAACRAVGLIRDEAEPWHWNNPRWTSMPIIPELPAATSGGTHTPIPTLEEAIMNKRINLRVIATPTSKPSDTLYFFSARRGLVPIQSRADAELLDRIDKVLNDGETTTILKVEYDRLANIYL